MDAEDVPTPDFIAFLKLLDVMELAKIRAELKASGDTWFVTAVDLEFRRRERQQPI